MIAVLAALLLAQAPFQLANDLQPVAKAIETAEVALLKAAPPPLRQSNPEPQSVQHFVTDHLDRTDQMQTKANPKLARTIRLTLAADGLGIWCFTATGLRVLAQTMADAASAMGQREIAAGLKEQANYLKGQIDQRCGGPGGRQSLREWEAIETAMANNMGPLHRSRCAPIPSPIAIACAPTAEEVYRPSRTEYAALAALFAAGLSTPVLVGAAPGTTWATLFEAATFAVP